MQQVMRRLARGIFLAVAAVSLFTLPLLAGNAHFVGVPQIAVSGDSLVASGKVAGLGNVPQIDVTLSADAACVNRGGNKPSAENKQTFSSAGSFPVQNGKALFTLDLEAVFQPACTPPMRVEWSNVQLTVTAADGTFLTYP
jgi:hypothetical protein